MRESNSGPLNGRVCHNHYAITSYAMPVEKVGILVANEPTEYEGSGSKKNFCMCVCLLFVEVNVSICLSWDSNPGRLISKRFQELHVKPCF